MRSAVKHVENPEANTRTIGAGEFKAKCLQLMDEVKETNLTLIVTKRGKEVGRFIAPPVEEASRSFIGASPGIKILGDIVNYSVEWPDPAAKWERNGWLPKSKPTKKRKRA